jgi:hypothetical protein
MISRPLRASPFCLLPSDFCLWWSGGQEHCDSGEIEEQGVNGADLDGTETAAGGFALDSFGGGDDGEETESG